MSTDVAPSSSPPLASAFPLTSQRVVVVVTDSEGTVTDPGDGARSMLALCHERDGKIHLLESDRSRICPISKEVRRCLSAGVDVEVEVECCAWHGTGRSVRVSASPRLDASGLIGGATVTFDDVQTVRRFEDLLRIERDLAIALGHAKGLTSALSAIMDAVLLVEGVDSGGVYLVDPATGRLDLVVHRGLGPEFVAHASVFSASDPRSGLVREGRVVFTRYVEVDVPRDSVLEREGLRALGIIPVRHEGQSVALLNVASHVHFEFAAPVQDAIVALASRIGAVIDRVRSEEAVRQSQSNFQALFDSLEDMLFVLDDAGRVIHANQVALRRLGYDLAEMIGKPVTELHPPERLQEVAFIVGEMLAGRQAACPIPLISESGVLIPVETVVTRGMWDGNSVVIGISRDVSRRQRAEDALQASENLHRAMFDHAPIGIVRMDAGGRLLHCNAAFQKLVDFAPDELQAMDVARLAHPDDLRQTIETYRDLVAGYCPSFTLELRFLRKDGGCVWVEVTVTAVHDPSGQFLFGLALIGDITARKLYEQTQHEVERQFRDMADASPTLIRVSDPDGHATFFNRTWLELTGRTIIQEFGEGWLDGVHPQERLGFVRDIGSEGHERREYRLRRGDGQYRWMLEERVRRRASDGTVLGETASCVDITERKDTEAERERLVVQLQNALTQVKTLRGLLPICSWCKKVRDDQGYWEQLDVYVTRHSDAEITHGACPECAARLEEETDRFLEEEAATRRR